MSEILITKPYDSYDAAIKEAYITACDIVKNNTGIIDVVIPTLDSSLINFLGVKAVEVLRKKRICLINGVRINLFSCETAKKVYESSCLLVLCVPDNFTKCVSAIKFEKCIVVPRHDRNVGNWENFQQKNV